MLIIHSKRVPVGSVCTQSAIEVQRNQLIQARFAPFIDGSTRLILITITTVSSNTGVVTNLRLATEFGYGAIVTSVSFLSAVFYRNSQEILTNQVLLIFLAILESIFVISTLWPIVFCKKISSWTWLFLDLLTSAFMIAQLVYYFTYYYTNSYYDDFETSLLVNDNNWSGTGFFSGQSLYDLQIVVVLNNGIILLSGLRLFRYSQYFDVMNVIHGTVDRAFFDSILYFFLNFFVSLAFMLCGHVVLGGTVPGWQTYADSLYTVLEYFVLSVDYYSVYDQQPFGLYFAPLFLVSFIFLFTWYLIAVYIAIVYVAYRTEKMRYEKDLIHKHRWTVEAKKATDFYDDKPNGRCIKLGSHCFSKLYYYPMDAKQYIRVFFGLPPIEGFRDLEGILYDLEKFKRKEPGKKFASFIEVFEIILGDKVVQFKFGKDEQDHNEVSSSSNLRSAIDPLLIQTCRLFHQLWVIPDSKKHVFNKFETEKTTLKRSVLIRIQEALQSLDRSEKEFTNSILEELQNLRDIQKDMEKDIRKLREPLK